MYHCNASGPSPWSDPPNTEPPGAVPPEQYPPHLYDRVVCELGRGHDGDCADHVGELSPDAQLWVLWEDDRFTYAVLRPCCMSDPTVPPVQQEPCTLYAGHTPGHSWQFTDMLHG
ncbi:hypothetical protein [Streptomyces sp. NPDC005435]|uniref:hypothetical protein n=1 Tax=Streptomyces sp. NPDC005435 TaxID=3154464 RepID=UPI003456A092